MLVVSQTDGTIHHDSLVCAFIFDSIAEEIETLLKSDSELRRSIKGEKICLICHHLHKVGLQGKVICGGESGNCFCMTGIVTADAESDLGEVREDRKVVLGNFGRNGYAVPEGSGTCSRCGFLECSCLK